MVNNILSDEVQNWLVNHLGAYGGIMERFGRLEYFVALRELHEQHPELGKFGSSAFPDLMEELRAQAEDTLILIASYKQVLEEQGLSRVLEEFGDNFSKLEDICYKIITS